MKLSEFVQIDKTNTLQTPCSYKDIEEKFDSIQADFIAILNEEDELLGSIYRNKFQTLEQETFDFEELLSKRFLYDYYHLFEAIREFLKCEKQQLPVIDQEGYYIGTCYLEKAQNHLNFTLGLIQGGSLITIRTTKQNYSLIDIARIAESNQAMILTLNLATHPDSDFVEVTLVLNTEEISDIVATYERFDYLVTYSSVKTERDDFLQNRYDSLMHYLDL